jgi:hypothetical protein
MESLIMKRAMGAGKVVNGRMIYMGEHGGFSKNVQPKEVVKPKEENIDIVFKFVQGRSHKKPMNVLEFKRREAN